MLNTHSSNQEGSSSDYLYAADSASLSITGDLTLQCWVKLESQPSNGASFTLMGKWTTTGDQRSYSLFYYNNAGEYRIYLTVSALGTGASSSQVYGVQTLTSGTWFHVAAVYAAVAHTAEFFVNGSSLGAAQDIIQTAIYNGTAQAQIGKDDSSAEYFDGLIDDVRVYNVARSVADINADYQQEIATLTNVAAYWKLNNSYLDETTNNNDLSTSGSPAFSTDVPFVGESGSFLAFM